jgi:MFS transporter, OFA family, oxalate/formate antiporter
VIFYGWRIVAAAFVILFTAYGAQYCFGVFFAALLDEFRWSRAGLAGVFSLYAFGYCVVGFPAGRLTDRWGPRVVVTTGAVFLGAALAGMALVHRLWEPYVIYGVIGAVGMGTAYVPCHSTVVKWFARRRGLAVGIASTGASLGTFALPPLAHRVVTAIGWRRAYLVLGVGVFVALALAAAVMRRDPRSMGLWPDGEDAPTSASGASIAAGWTLGDAMHTRAFWLIAAAFTATWLAVFIPLVHLVPFARDLGYDARTGAWLVSALGAGAVGGRLVMGAVSDRTGRRPAIVAAMLLQAAAFVAFASVRGLHPLLATAVAFGFSYGTISALFAAIVGDLFGAEQAGSLVGLLFAVAGTLAAWGPLVAGLVYDTTGSYGPVFHFAAAANVLAAVLIGLARGPVRQVKFSRR